MEKAREFWKNIYFCFSDYAKAFDCVGHNKLWKILKEMGYQTTFTCLMRNLMKVTKQQLEPDMKQLMVQNGERGTTRQYIATLFI